MSKTIKVLLSVFLCSVLFVGCSTDNKQVKYDLTICDSNMDSIYSYFENFVSENYKLAKYDFSENLIDDFKNNFDNKFLNSITIYSINISDEQANQIIEFAKSKNIPIIFAMSEISLNILNTYDKAVCLVTDFSHAGELTAKKINDMWKSQTIVDTDGDKIFSFSIIKDAELVPYLNTFYNSLLENIELYGVPLHKVDEVNIDDVTSLDAFNQVINKVEGVIVISNYSLSLINEYTKNTEGVNIIAYNNGSANSYNSPFAATCFVNFQDYKKSTDEMIFNFNNKKHIIDNISFPYTDLTVYIPAII